MYNNKMMDAQEYAEEEKDERTPEEILAASQQAIIDHVAGLIAEMQPKYVGEVIHKPDEDFYRVELELVGPKESDYKGELLRMELRFTQDYPETCPTARFLCPVEN